MNIHKLAPAGILSLVLAQTVTAPAISRAPETVRYTSTQLRRMIQKAHTQDEYLVLARYFAQRRIEYAHRAADEMAEWARRSEVMTGPAAKYPRPVDVARNLYDYYQHEADDAAFQADKYRRFADGVAALSKH